MGIISFSKKYFFIFFTKRSARVLRIFCTFRPFFLMPRRAGGGEPGGGAGKRKISPDRFVVHQLGFDPVGQGGVAWVARGKRPFFGPKRGLQRRVNNMKNNRFLVDPESNRQTARYAWEMVRFLSTNGSFFGLLPFWPNGEMADPIF